MNRLPRSMGATSTSPSTLRASRRAGGADGDGFGVGRPAVAGARFVARRGDERVDGAREAVGVPVDQLEHALVLAFLARAPQCKLGLREHSCEWSAELVRELGGEAA